MSTLLEQASLIMIPSGYKEDVVYSVIPENGNGDLSFTRASNGTRVNSAGLVEVCPWNLQTYSEDFTNGTYTVNQASITSNATTAPNGTLTADKLVENTANDQHFLYFTSQQIAYNETRISVYAKAGGRTNLLMWESAITNAQCLFNLSTGVVTSSSSGNAANLSTTVGQIEDAGNGWYRCSFNYSTSSGGGTIRLQLYTTTTSYTGDGTSGVFLWGLQENIGATAKPYFPTTDRLNVPRLTYQNGGGGCPSLLLEKQSTNLVTYSEQFDNAGWTKSDSTVTANATTSPDGTQNADKLIESATNAAHSIYQVSATTASVITTSVFLKQSELRYAVVFISNTVNKNFAVLFDLQLGVVVTNFTSISSYAAPTSSSIENYGNGWFRCIVTATDTFTNASCAVALNRSGADSGFSYMGDGTSGLYIWGAQLESGSYPTSYIPTTSSSATRVADSAYKTGISSLFGTNQGTFFIDFLYLNSVTVDYLFDVTDSINNERFLWYSPTGNDIYTFYDSQNSGFATYQLTKGQRYKIGVKYNSSGTFWYVNGVLSATGTSGFAYQMAQIYLGQRYSLVQQTQMQVNQSIVFPTALSNADIIALTTI